MAIKNNDNTFKFSIRMVVVFFFVIVSILTASVTIGFQYYFSKTIATEAALSHYNLTAENTRNYLESLEVEAVNSAQMLVKYPDLIAGNWINEQAREFLAQVMRNHPVFFSIYVGFGNGDHYQLINVDADPIVRRQFNALAQDRWIVVTISNNARQRIRRYEFYDKSFILRGVREEKSSFYANKRPWYTNATAGEVYKTDPYLFQNLKAPGQTYSTVIPSTDAVLGIDIALSSLSSYLSQQQLNSESEIYLYKTSGEIIASNVNKQASDALAEIKPITLTSRQKLFIANYPTIKIANSLDWTPIDFAVSGMPKGYAVDIVSLISKMTGLQFQYINGFNWPQLVDKFKQHDLDMLPAIYQTAVNKSLGIVSAPFLRLPLALITKPEVATISHIGQLAERKLAVIQGWSMINELQQHFPKIDIVAVKTLKDVIEAVRRGEVDAGLDVGVVFEHVARQFFMDGIKYHHKFSFQPLEFPDNLHFLLQHGNSELADIINLAIANITPIQQQALLNKWFEQQADVATTGVVPYVELIEDRSSLAQADGLSIREINGVEYFIFSKLLNVKTEQTEVFSIITPASNVLDDSLTQVNLSIAVTLVCLLVILPISWFMASLLVKPIRLLVQQNNKIKMRHFEDITPVKSSVIEIKELSLSLADMSASIKQQEHAQRELLDSFVHVISQAIDDKSPYTAGHCERVPELAMMLVDVASESKQAPFKNFSLNDNERREFNLAAWLHDCGKVTTPEHIIDKSTKLEMIYNRIHEIRMRFEVLWRDAEIDYLTNLSKEPHRADILTERLTKKKAELVDDFEFIANANIGGEFMDDRDVLRLTALSKVTWQRYFDNTLGLSAVEAARCQGHDGDFPVTENLLQDKPEHLIEHNHEIKFDPKFNIKMEVPQYLYNNGELYNLSITRGTLTAEDRFKINEHIISTIKMLEGLKLPPELAKVPRYASSHHETMKGTGYPRKLSADDLSIPERIMVVADIFEALTAADRPYKPAKPVSVVLDILHKLALENYIDIEVFKLFLSSGIYLKYSERFLPKAQLDSIDLDKYLKQSANNPAQ